MIELKTISKAFKLGNEDFFALKDLSLKIPENKITVISGPSGSGKSTLLSIIGLLQTPTTGELLIDDKKINFSDASFLRSFISQNVTYVFQEANLIDDFSVVDNLRMISDDLKAIDDILVTIGLLSKKQTPTKLLSGGEKQRLAIGRAIAKGGSIILFDEPTGNLDEENSHLIFDLLKRFSLSKTIIVVTHNMKMASIYADFLVLLNSGRIISQFSLNQNSFEVDLVNHNIDGFLPLLDHLSYRIKNNIVRIQVSDGTSRKDYLISDSTLLSVFNEIYLEYQGKAITILIISETETELNPSPLNATYQASNVFPPKFVFKYSTVLFKNKLWRNIFSIFLLILNMAMIFVYTNIATYDYVTATKNAITENNAIFSQPYLFETNDVTLEMNRYFSGAPLYDALSELGADPLPMLRVNSDLLGLQLSLVVIDQPIRFKDTLIAPPSINKIIVSNFISKLVEDEEITISSDLNNEFYFNDYVLTIEKIISSNVDPHDMQNFLNDSNYQNVVKDKFVNEYSIVFVSKETFTQIKKSPEFRLPAANFFLSDSNQSMQSYASNKLYYATFASNNLVAGRAPTDEYEVVVTTSLFEQYQFFTGFESMNECLEKEFNYRDLNDSPNRDLYQTILNLYEITPKIRIV
ncbi:MAG: ABC transporter ATP-binding protein, partial [Erysipelotrichaceae bacterium]|nr:ABC transporter ATP-binding protein [Erysipelotrichaceae bacterium]